MDAYDLFKKLSAGTKLNLQRFKNDAERFSLVKKTLKEEKEVIKIESPDPELEELESRSKRKLEEDDSEGENTFTLYEGVKVSQDGKVSKQKKKKQKILTEEEKLQKKRKRDKEKVNHFRNQHHISVIGGQVPNPIENFQQLATTYKVGSDLLSNMSNCGYNEPTPIQMQALSIMLEGKEVLACAPTGSGKTAAFLLPIIHQLIGPKKQGFRAVVLSPTRELAKQTYRECLKLSEGRGFRVHIISKINQALSQYGPKSSQKFDILITTPKRLTFLLNQDTPAISLKNVEWLVVDEADKLFEEGTRGFRDQLNEISKACTNPNLRRAMFSATNTPAVTRWCRENLKGWITVTIGLRNAATDLIEQELLFVGDEGGKLMAMRNIIQKGLSPPVLVFVQSKERAQELFSELIYDGINVDVTHADRTQNQRDNVVRCFREGKIWVLVCTELMSRGIDFKGVNLVINFDFPPSAISYIHRIGRTGRAGHKGKAITFFTQQDVSNLRSIAEVMRASGCEVPEYMLAIKKLDKRIVKKLRHETPKRQRIATSLKYKRRHGAKDKPDDAQDLEKKIENRSFKGKEKLKGIAKMKGKISNKAETHKGKKIKNSGDRKKTLLSKKVKSKKGFKKTKKSVIEE